MNRAIITVVLTAALIGCAQPKVFRSPSLIGVVIDADNNSPIPGARVSAMSKPEISAETNGQGQFELPGKWLLSWERPVPVGPFPPVRAVEVAAPGYETAFVPYWKSESSATIKLAPTKMRGQVAL